MITFYCPKTAFYRYGGFIYRGLLSGIKKTLPGQSAGGSGVEEKYISSRGLRPT